MRVLCTLPNASELIGGVRYTKTDLGMLSDEISADEAARLARIPGYTPVYASEAGPVVDEPEPVPEPAPAPKPKRGRPPAPKPAP